MLLLPTPQVALVDIRGQVVKHRDEGSDFFSTRYEGMEVDYLDAHIPGAVFVDWTKVNSVKGRAQCVIRRSTSRSPLLTACLPCGVRRPGVDERGLPVFFCVHRELGWKDFTKCSSSVEMGNVVMIHFQVSPTLFPDLSSSISRTPSHTGKQPFRICVAAVFVIVLMVQYVGRCPHDFSRTLLSKYDCKYSIDQSDGNNTRQHTRHTHVRSEI